MTKNIARDFPKRIHRRRFFAFPESMAGVTKQNRRPPSYYLRARVFLLVVCGPRPNARALYYRDPPKSVNFRTRINVNTLELDENLSSDSFIYAANRSDAFYNYVRIYTKSSFRFRLLALSLSTRTLIVRRPSPVVMYARIHFVRRKFCSRSVADRSYRKNIPPKQRASLHSRPRTGPNSLRFIAIGIQERQYDFRSRFRRY